MTRTPQPALLDNQDLQFHSLELKKLDRFLERRRARPWLELEISLSETLAAILRKANEFVPSAAGAILLDNPHEKDGKRQDNSLTFVAALGDKANNVVGQEIAADLGIAGHVYMSGTSYFADDVKDDGFFYPQVDQGTEFTTMSIVAIPIRIEQEVCGVLELINRQSQPSYSEQDVNLLEIFAGYISVSIQNILDGRQAQELAKRDNLTGLYNDRYLHIALAEAVTQARQADEDLGLVFLDLDFFKRVNDNHGHLAGSQVLHEVGRLLADSLPDPATIAARYGGDEFVLAVPRMGLEGIVGVAERIRQKIVGNVFCDRPGVVNPEALHLKGITCSLGVATLRRHVDAKIPDDSAKTTLLRIADVAMYVAKETGRNRTVRAGEPVEEVGSGD